MIAQTRFNDNYNKRPSIPYKFVGGNNDNMSPISFTITQDLLNQALLNITLSAIVQIGYWQTPTNVTLRNSINLFRFSKPLNLLLPYFLSLALALPILILGGFILKRNGV